MKEIEVRVDLFKVELIFYNVVVVLFLYVSIVE